MLSRLAQVTVILLILTSTVVFSKETPVSVLVNVEVQTDALTSSQLRKIFSMRQTVWPDGQPIIVFVLKTESAAHQALCKDVLKMFPYQIERLWNKLAYSGLGDKPTELSNQKEMLEKLQQTPGAIGYMLNINSGNKIKKIEVVGE
ncbi:hypothetical protein GLIP_2845 [Aliiglaciecola lipolytica E3]|uniref:PBP domain-containing protein n=1 Tax=Aliiglaciecola lipolytica E3 TaxID=1127673 RepID=K6XUW8_9ALTE|nr:hypothetical protein [Aliiglaciecola lipolytica]GAC15466.1 hypothetical protein GLIP_2845 [Aliiglaciecola lipolytica E3]